MCSGGYRRPPSCRWGWTRAAVEMIQGKKENKTQCKDCDITWRSFSQHSYSHIGESVPLLLKPETSEPFRMLSVPLLPRVLIKGRRSFPCSEAGLSEPALEWATDEYGSKAFWEYV